MYFEKHVRAKFVTRSSAIPKILNPWYPLTNCRNHWDCTLNSSNSPTGSYDHSEIGMARGQTTRGSPLLRPGNYVEAFRILRASDTVLSYKARHRPEASTIASRLRKDCSS